MMRAILISTWIGITIGHMLIAAAGFSTFSHALDYSLHTAMVLGCVAFSMWRSNTMCVLS